MSPAPGPFISCYYYFLAKGSYLRAALEMLPQAAPKGRRWVAEDHGGGGGCQRGPRGCVRRTPFPARRCSRGTSTGPQLPLAASASSPRELGSAGAPRLSPLRDSCASCPARSLRGSTAKDAVQYRCQGWWHRTREAAHANDPGQELCRG